MRLLAILLLCWAGVTQASSADYVRVADRVLLVPDSTGSTTRFEMIVNAGSADEADGNVTGIAHYLEHLVLVGRNAQHGDAVLRMFADASANGWTNERATVYLHTLPARPDGAAADLERLFSFYAARLSDFAITEAEAARERNVVLQEHDQGLASSITTSFYRDVTRRLVPDHPVGQSTIGTRESISRMSLEAARAYHAAWYVPGNVWFVVRGEIAPDRLREIVARTLPAPSSRPLPERLRDRLPRTEGADSFVMAAKDLTRPIVTVARLVRIEEGDRLVTGARLAMLSNFASSRFPGSAYDQLVETRQVAAEDLSVWLRRVAPSTYAISLAASVPVEGSAEALRDAMIGYVDTLAKDGVPGEAVLERLKKRSAEQWARASKVASQRHGLIVNWLAGGNELERIGDWPGLIGRVEPDDVRALARGFSAPGRQVVGKLEPVEAMQ